MRSRYMTPAVRAEARHIWQLLWPICISNALLMALQIEDQIFLGHIGVKELGASALGTTLYNLAWLFLAGAASACDTLIAQAYGARDYKATEYWTRMGYLVMTILTVPAMVLFQFGEWFIRNVFRQDDELSRMGGRYTQLLLPGLWFLSMFIVMQKSLQARNILMPSVWIMVAANVLNVLFNYVFIYALDLGFDGSPIATSTSRIITALMMAVYYYIILPRSRPNNLMQQGHSYAADLQGEEPDDVLGGDGDSALQEALLTKGNSRSSSNGGVASSTVPSTAQVTRDSNAIAFREAFGRFLALAIAGGIMVGLEAWSFDWTIPFAGQFGEESLDAHQSLMSVSAFTYLTVPLAISIAASIRVGNLLGAQRPKQAQLAARICLAIGVSCMLVCGFIIVGLKDYLGRIFSSDEKVIHLLSTLCPIMALYQVFDGFQGVSAGVLRGMGRQKRVALLNLGGFWVLGLPGGVLLAFTCGLGLKGIWIGFNLGLLVISFLYLWALSKIDYEEEARRALENAVTDTVLEKAWEHTVDAEKEAAGVRQQLIIHDEENPH